MRKVTLCFLRKNGELCLAMKKRGFGEGKWNGVGGKVADDESVAEATVRELNEEIGVVASENDLIPVGDLQFSFENKPEWSQHMHIYFLDVWQGEPQESDEMAPRWYSFADIPYKAMWVDDIYWLPKVLSGNVVQGIFHFSEEGSDILHSEVREVGKY